MTVTTSYLPQETSEVIKSGKVPSHDRSAMIDGLRKNLNISRVLVVTVFPSADKLCGPHRIH